MQDKSAYISLLFFSEKCAIYCDSEHPIKMKGALPHHYHEMKKSPG
jgi:hypothetical protein